MKERRVMAMNQYQAAVPSESVEQICLFRWAGYSERMYPELKLMYHIPNGGKRNITTAKRLKAEGVKAGVPDIHLPVSRGKYHSLYIEMKKIKGNTTSENQDFWIEALEEQGNRAVVCHGWEEASRTIIAYLELNKNDEQEEIKLIKCLDYKNNLFEMMNQVMSDLYPDIRAIVIVCSGLFENEGAYGCTTFPDDGSIPIIEIDVNVPIGSFPEILAHEIAHVVVGPDAGHGTEWEKEFDLLQTKWTELLEKRMEIIESL